MRIARAFALAALAALVTTAACEDEEKRERGLPPAEAADLLVNRTWIDHMPGSEDEKLHVYRFTPAMGGGIYQDRTLYAGEFELFTFEVDERTLRIDWPHRDLREEVRFEIERVEGPRPFDLRLRLHGNSTGPSVYYGQSGEGKAASEPLVPPLR